MTESTPYRILLAVTGLTPQIVTETLYALACRKTDPWIPQEVHLITTATGANNARGNLLAGECWFQRLLKDYDLPPITFTADHIHVVRDADGQPLEDIRTQAHNTLAADFITETLRELTENPDTELHVSIAGGRKTMGYYMGYALSLYGRPQDRLSHVLVSDPYETNREFYYPTPYEHWIHSKRGDKELTVDARHAEVDLADIPFVQLRDGLTERLRTGQASFSQVVKTANRGLRPAHLVLNEATREVWADDEPVKLSDTLFLVLLWLAKRAQSEEPATDWSTLEMCEEFLDLVKQVSNLMDDSHDRIRKAIVSCNEKPELHRKYFEPHKSNINKALKNILGPRPAERYMIRTKKGNRITYVELPLDPDQITIHHS